MIFLTRNKYDCFTFISLIYIKSIFQSLNVHGLSHGYKNVKITIRFFKKVLKFAKFFFLNPLR